MYDLKIHDYFVGLFHAIMSDYLDGKFNNQELVVKLRNFRERIVDDPHNQIPRDYIIDLLLIYISKCSDLLHASHNIPINTFPIPIPIRNSNIYELIYNKGNSVSISFTYENVLDYDKLCKVLDNLKYKEGNNAYLYFYDVNYSK